MASALTSGPTDSLSLTLPTYLSYWRRRSVDPRDQLLLDAAMDWWHHWRESPLTLDPVLMGYYLDPKTRRLVEACADKEYRDQQKRTAL